MVSLVHCSEILNMPLAIAAASVTTTFFYRDAILARYCAMACVCLSVSLESREFYQNG